MLIFSCPKAVGFEQGPHSCNQLMKIEMIPAKKSEQTFNVADCLPSSHCTMMRFFKTFTEKQGKANGARFCIILMVYITHFKGFCGNWRKLRF
jgi:hypothetical protein